MTDSRAWDLVDRPYVVAVVDEVCRRHRDLVLAARARDLEAAERLGELVRRAATDVDDDDDTRWAASVYLTFYLFRRSAVDRLAELAP